MGTPEYARRILELIAAPSHRFLVLSKPDVPVGRHRRVTPSPVSCWALSQGMELLRPARLLDEAQAIHAFQPDYLLTAAFGRILRPWLLNAPRFGAYNLHASLLPRWRGPNPVAWAIRAGDSVSGVTLMAMDEGIDTGPIVAQARLPIELEDTRASLTEKMADLGAHLWQETLRRYPYQAWPVTPQSPEGIKFAPKFGAEEARIDWSRDAVQIDAHIRSLAPEPGAYALLGPQHLKILEAKTESAIMEGPPGRLVSAASHWLVACGQGVLRILAVKAPGRRTMAPGDYLRGYRGDFEWMLH